MPIEDYDISSPLRSGDFTVTQGSTISGYFVSQVDGTVSDLSGYSARGFIKLKLSDTGSLLDLQVAVDSGDTSVGKVDMLIDYSESASLPVGVFPYDIEVFDNSFVHRVSSGKVTVVPEVTT